jgi:poly-gamma-glutamate capsule biosynthesis protein CapA/YwtB (metallophosphatase superfamily)
MQFRLALGGDAIINRRVSNCGDDSVRTILNLYRESDLGIANCEMLFHDFTGEGVYPSAEAGWTFMRAPSYVADELKLLNIKLVGTANNHFLDYSYGGMFSTHAALKSAGIEFAGSGRDLAEARTPAYIDTPHLRVSLVSMTSSATLASRASMPHDGIPGRPGVNPLGWHFTGDKQAIQRMVDAATQFGWWIAKVSDREWQFNPPGLHNTLTRYFEVDEPGTGMVLDHDDRTGNLRSIKSARSMSDLVVVHVHNHEWDQASGTTTVPPAFMTQFAKDAIDAGADIVLAQGCHAPIRGIEVYKGKPIFYDPGDLFAMSGQVSRFPQEFYTRHDMQRRQPMNELLTSDAVAGRRKYFRDYMVNPVGGYQNGRGRLGVVPLLQFDGNRLQRLELHPFSHDHDTAALFGMPAKPEPEIARKIISDLAALSSAFGTKIQNDGAIGVMEFAAA